MPCLANSTKPMNTSPRIASDIRRSVGRSDGTTRSMSETSADPTIGPPSVPAPPTRTVTNARTEFASPASCAETKRVEYAESAPRSEEHTSELQSRVDLVCRLLLEKKKKEYIERLN